MINLLREIGEPPASFGVKSVSVEEDGSLRHCVPRYPLHFRFNWRYAHFNATIDRLGERLVLCLGTELGALPYTAEDPVLRGQLVATVSGVKDTEFGRIDVQGGRIAVVTKELPLAPGIAFTSSDLVTSVAVAVLGAAPCLDLLAASGLFAAHTG